MIAARDWRELVTAVSRAPFIPDVIWVRQGDGFTALSKRDDPDGWCAAVNADAPVVTQVDFGDVGLGAGANTPSSSCSQPSIVAEMLNGLRPQPGDRVLEIGTGTGWNAALLSHGVVPGGRVVSIEVDPQIAEHAREALSKAGYCPLVVTGDGEIGYPDEAPYERVIATAAIRDGVPHAWLEQLRPGGRLVTPWGTDWSNGFMLTIDKGEDGVGRGRFSGDLAFMRLRQQRRLLHEWEPDESQQALADESTTECRGVDLDRMYNPGKGLFAIGARLRDCCAHAGWEQHGRYHHNLEFDDGRTLSWAQVDADVTDPALFRVRQLGPRRLWDEVEAAYDWWHEVGEPAMDRFGFEARDGRQWIWLDEPANVVRFVT